MKSNSAAAAAVVPTGTKIGEQVAISIRDEAPLPSPTIANIQFYEYIGILCFSVIFFMGLLIPVRIGMMLENENKPSPFRNNGVFIITSVVAVFVNLPATVFLICTNYYFQISWMRMVHFTIVKCIGYFSAILAPVSLFMVLFIPHNLSWIGFLVICLIFGIALVLCYSDGRVQNKSGKFIINYTALLLAPISLVLVIFIPSNLNWIVNSTVFLFFAIELVYIFIGNRRLLNKIKKQNMQPGSSSSAPGATQ